MSNVNFRLEHKGVRLIPADKKYLQKNRPKNGRSDVKKIPRRGGNNTLTIMYPKHIVTVCIRLRPYTSQKRTRDTA